MQLDKLLNQLASAVDLTRFGAPVKMTVSHVQCEGEPETVANTLQLRQTDSQLQFYAHAQLVATIARQPNDAQLLLRVLTLCSEWLDGADAATAVLPLAIAATTADFQVTLAQAAGMLGNPLAVLHLDGQKILRYTNARLAPDSAIGKFLAAHVPAIAPTSFYQHLYITNAEQSPTPLLLTPLSYHNNALGYLVMAVATTPLAPMHVALMPKLAQLIAHVAVAQHVIEKTLSARDRLVNLLLDSPVDDSWAAQFRLQHAVLPHGCVIVQAMPAHENNLSDLREKLSYLAAPMFTQVLITLAHKRCWALISVSLTDYHAQAFHDKLDKLAAQAQCRLIVSQYYVEPSQTKAAAAVCQKAARLSVPQSVVYCEDAAFDLMLAQVQDGDSILPFFINPAIQALSQYDADNHTELVKTLQAYLQTLGSQVDTAQNLFIHPNTLRNRLQRIFALTGLDLKDAQTCFKLAASYKVAAYLKAQRL